MLFLYSVYDNIRKSSVLSFTAPNDGIAVRDNSIPLSKMLPLGDLELRCVGEIDDNSGFISNVYDVTSEQYHIVSWDSYKFPESPIKPLPKDVKNLEQIKK